MKNLNNIKLAGKTVSIVCCGLLFSHQALAGEVTYGDDTYTTGDTLTASDLNAKFNEIKAQVNDNNTNVAGKQNSITGTCPAGQAIREVGADGLVTCEVDSDTTYTAGTGLSMTGTDIKIRSDYYYVHPAEFNSGFQTDESSWGYNSATQRRFYAFPKVGNTFLYASAGIHLPGGVTVTSVDCYFLDNNAAHGFQDMSFNLQHGVTATGNVTAARNLTSMAYVNSSTTAADASLSIITTSDTTINRPVINNGSRFYTLTVSVRTTAGYTATDASELRFYGCRIGYSS